MRILILEARGTSKQENTDFMQNKCLYRECFPERVAYDHDLHNSSNRTRQEWIC